jgi:hypothetical protein
MAALTKVTVATATILVAQPAVQVLQCGLQAEAFNLVIVGLMLTLSCLVWHIIF